MDRCIVHDKLAVRGESKAKLLAHIASRHEKARGKIVGLPLYGIGIRMLETGYGQVAMQLPPFGLVIDPMSDLVSGREACNLGTEALRNQDESLVSVEDTGNILGGSRERDI